MTLSFEREIESEIESENFSCPRRQADDIQSTCRLSGPFFHVLHGFFLIFSLFDKCLDFDKCNVNC